jgi:hypothetical protein
MVQQGEATLQRLLHPELSSRLEHDDDGWRDVVMQPRHMLHFGKPERLF